MRKIIDNKKCFFEGITQRMFQQINFRVLMIDTISHSTHILLILSQISRKPIVTFLVWTEHLSCHSIFNFFESCPTRKKENFLRNKKLNENFSEIQNSAHTYLRKNCDCCAKKLKRKTISMFRWQLFTSLRNWDRSSKKKSEIFPQAY